MVIAVLIAATQLSGLQGTLPDGKSDGREAPEFTEIASWVNSPPLTMESLRGKVVWIDFWTYSCINCIRTLPAVRAMYARYHPFGLETIGIHSPEFDFEKKLSNVQAAVRRHQVPYPVALDSAMATWRAYDNNYWPRVYLVDRSGRIRFDHAGEGGEADIERHLRELLAADGTKLPPPLNRADYDLPRGITPEIYVGYERGSRQGSLANPEGWAPMIATEYRTVPAFAVQRAGTTGSFFLQGRWRTDDEFAEAVEDGAKVILPFKARTVYAVVSPHPGGAAKVSVELDGRRVNDLVVGDEDLVTLTTVGSFGAHVLTLTVEAGFRLYTFTFG